MHPPSQHHASDTAYPLPHHRRQGQVHEALGYAQTTLAALRKALPHLGTQLQDVVALVAYEQPAVGDSSDLPSNLA